jgi:hypothetical protein
MNVRIPLDLVDCQKYLNCRHGHWQEGQASHLFSPPGFLLGGGGEKERNMPNIPKIKMIVKHGTTCVSI